MKKLLFATIIAVVGVFPALGQGVQVSVLGGMQLFGSTNGYNIKDDWNGEIVLGKDIGAGRVVEFSYTLQRTYLEDKVRGGLGRMFDLNVEYYQIGVAQEANPGAMTVPYGLFTLGAVRYNPKDNSSYPRLRNLDDEWRFAVTLGGGVRHYINETVGIRFSTRLMMPLTFSGGGLFCGTGGCSVGVGSYTTFMQAEVSLGLTFKLGNK